MIDKHKKILKYITAFNIICTVAIFPSLLLNELLGGRFLTAYLSYFASFLFTLYYLYNLGIAVILLMLLYCTAMLIHMRRKNILNKEVVIFTAVRIIVNISVPAAVFGFIWFIGRSV